MTRIALALVACAMVVATAISAAASDTSIVIDGVGAAHGFGMAMDGVQGQARAGWSHDKILSLFYPGTSIGHAGGPVRVGLTHTASTDITVPSGGIVADGAAGTKAPGLSVPLAPGAHITVRSSPAGITLDGLPTAQHRAMADTVKPTPSPPAPQGLLPTAPPIGKKPEPKPKPTATPAPAPAQSRTYRSIWIWGTGRDGLVQVGATGHRYRGQITLTPDGGQLLVVNTVDLETYVAGIAEEKGQGWPIEGMEALAVAARSLAAATMSWYRHSDSYDICPDANCQLYLGYDGEDASMRQAAAATAGVIRTYNGRPILAMYHGNGGGQTESYSTAIDNGTDPYPYLRSVRYPFARPSRWQVDTTIGSIEASLRSAGIAVPDGLRSITVTKRGASPRVLQMRLDGATSSTEVSGTRFASALDLRSTWFTIRTGAAASAAVLHGEAFGSPLSAPASAGAPTSASQAWWTTLLLATISLVTLAAAVAIATDHLPSGASGLGPLDPMRRPRLGGSHASG